MFDAEGLAVGIAQRFIKQAAAVGTALPSTEGVPLEEPAGGALAKGLMVAVRQQHTKQLFER